MKIIPIILSGGAGTRLWPLSWGDHPKQFLKLTSCKRRSKKDAGAVKRGQTAS